MLDAWLKGKFYSKCKTAIKLTKTRLDYIRKKRNATEKYLKNDIAELLNNDLDVNAYGRSEGLLVELNHSRCYDLIEKYCQQILDNLPTMTKQRECPEDCKEAVSTLMFAAARFADLPELRYLRTIFAERYGSSIDYFVSKEFMEKLKSERPSKDVKLQLMQDIASESGIEWDSKSLEQKLYKPPQTEQVSILYDEKDEYKTDGHLSSRNPEKESDIKVPFYKSIPPPYTRPQGHKMKGTLDASAAGLDGEVQVKSSQENDNDDRVQEAKTKTKPQSVRRIRNLAPEKEKRNSNCGKKTSSDDDNDQQDVETRLNTLLAHYSRKKSVAGKPDTEESKPPPEQDEASSSKIPRRRSIDAPPSRASSLPVESTQTEIPKGHFRTASYHSDTLVNPKGHVHPKLPEYDDLIARLAAARADMDE